VEAWVRVRGAEIGLLSWGDLGTQPIVFVHGGAAHAWWWSFTAPLLADRAHVVALDMSGHGTSDRHDSYDFDTWVDEVLGVALSLPGPRPINVGHSLGGVVVSHLGNRRETDELGGLVVVDSPLRPDEIGGQGPAFETSLARPRTYPDKAAAVAAYRLRPIRSRRWCRPGWTPDGARGLVLNPLRSACSLPVGRWIPVAVGRRSVAAAPQPEGCP
jgi:pimeloyl-ACP methyl ester carboxylesterase